MFIIYMHKVWICKSADCGFEMVLVVKLWTPEQAYIKKFPNCLCLIFFVQLNCVHKSKQNKVLQTYIKLPCDKVAPGIPLPLIQ